MATTAPRITVAIPAHQAAGEVGRAISALLQAGFAAEDILVVDDGSRDDTAERARALGVRLLRNAEPMGAAQARNRAAAESEGDVIFFVDADVVVHADVRIRLERHFGTVPGLDAVIGSYDDDPDAATVAGRYRNLLHHFVHQSSQAEAPTFWTGLGAVNRSRFLALGGFDRTWEKIEDSEFGVRLRRAGGRILLDHALLGKHLKVWTAVSIFRTDLFGRAIPWSRLVLFHDGPRNDLNLGAAHRLSVVMVALFGASALGAILEPRLVFVAIFAAAGFIWANRSFLEFLRRREGLGFALAALPLHALHYLAGGLGFAWVLATEWPRHALGWRTGSAS